MRGGRTEEAVSRAESCSAFKIPVRWIVGRAIVAISLYYIAKRSVVWFSVVLRKQCKFVVWRLTRSLKRTATNLPTGRNVKWPLTFTAGMFLYRLLLPCKKLFRVVIVCDICEFLYRLQVTCQSDPRVRYCWPYRLYIDYILVCTPGQSLMPCKSVMGFPIVAFWSEMGYTFALFSPLFSNLYFQKFLSLIFCLTG